MVLGLSAPMDDPASDNVFTFIEDSGLTRSDTFDVGIELHSHFFIRHLTDMTQSARVIISDLGHRLQTGIQVRVLHEIHPFYGAPVLNIEAGYDAFG